MLQSLHRIITLIGTSLESWEKASISAIEQSPRGIEDMRIAQVEELDMYSDETGAIIFRAKLKVCYKFNGQ